MRLKEMLVLIFANKAVLPINYHVIPNKTKFVVKLSMSSVMFNLYTSPASKERSSKEGVSYEHHYDC